MKSVVRWLDQHVEELLMSLFLCGVVVMMTIHVFCRYVLQSPLTWSEEATRYMFIWFVFMGVSYGIRNHTHIRVNILEVICPKLTPALSLVQDLLSAAFILYMTPAALRSMGQLAERGQTSAGLHLPMVFVYGALMIGLLLSIVRLIQCFYERITGAVKREERGEKG